jgi:hypothetical protein
MSHDVGGRVICASINNKKEQLQFLSSGALPSWYRDAKDDNRKFDMVNKAKLSHGRCSNISTPC